MPPYPAATIDFSRVVPIPEDWGNQEARWAWHRAINGDDLSENGGDSVFDERMDDCHYGAGYDFDKGGWTGWGGGRDKARARAREGAGNRGKGKGKRGVVGRRDGPRGCGVLPRPPPPVTSGGGLLGEHP